MELGAAVALNPYLARDDGLRVFTIQTANKTASDCRGGGSTQGLQGCL